MQRYLIILFLLSAMTVGLAPTSVASSDGEETIGGIPLEILTRPIPLRSELVSVHQPTSTESTTAQAYYDQGMTALQMFGWIEASRSLHTALEYDPELALAWLGLSEVYARLPDRDASLAALERAEALAAKQDLSERERVWMDLRARIRRESQPLLLWDEDKAEALRADAKAAAKQFPDAPEFPFLLGAIVPSDERVSWLKATLELNPDHAGAHHHLVHRYELDQDKVALAVKHGERLRELVPTQAHARHMLGHNLGRAGRMEEALAEFEATDRIERYLEREEGVLLEYDWHHAHNLGFLVLVNYYLGNFEAAETALARYRETGGQLDPIGRDRALIMFEFGYRLGRGDWVALSALAERARSIGDQQSLAVAEYIDASGMVAGQQINAAREAMERGDAVSGNTDLPRTMRTAQEVSAAVLASLEGDDEPFETLAERLANDSNPHAWIRAHWHLEGLARLMIANGLQKQAERATAILRQHDPYY